jgi:NitT/TauT family transport system substrate-binding protein
MKQAWLIGLVGALVAWGCRKERDAPQPLRVGLLPNVTHAQALVGDHEQAFARALAPAHLAVKQFNAGPSAMEALISGSLEVSYVGTGPAINAYLKGGRGLRIIAAAVNGGAVLVTRSARSWEDLRAKTLAAPQIGNTQDIALRHWLRGHGLEPGRDVQVFALANPEIQGMFERGELEGAWVPEPWGARMIAAGGRMLVDERELWPERRFHTTVIVTTQRALERRREDIKKLLRAHVELTRKWQENPSDFVGAVAAAFKAHAGKELDPGVLADAFSRLEPALRPDDAHVHEVARHARELGYAASDEVSGIVDRSLLDEVMRDLGLAYTGP